MYPRLLQPPPQQSFFLFGPRGVGKTAWAHEQFPDALFFDLLDHQTYTQLLAAPERLRPPGPPCPREEVQQEGFARNIGAFGRFLEAASFSQGSVLNMAAVARECAVSAKVVEDYFSILEDLLIAVRLPVFTKTAKRRLLAHPEFFYFDAGVYQAIRPRGPLDAPEQIHGAALEPLFLGQLRALSDYRDR